MKKQVYKHTDYDAIKLMFTGGGGDMHQKEMH